MPRKVLILPILLFNLFILRFVFNLYSADYFYQQNQPQQAVNLVPGNPTFLMAQASVFAQSNNPSKAIKSAQQALLISPGDINLYKLQSQMYTQLATVSPNYIKDAIKSLEKAQLLAPTDPTLPNQIGQLLFAIDQPKLALPYFQKALSLKPNYDHVMLPLAQIYIEQKMYSDAKKLLESAISINPKNQKAKDLLKKVSNLI